MKKEAKYYEITSKFYDVVYDKLRSPIDKKFYLEEIASCKGRTLEIGCGTGRIFVDALKAGADIYGIDGSEHMINKLKSKLGDKDAHRVSVADARSYKTNEKFDLVIAPFRVFSHMFTVDDQLSFLATAKSVMKEGARFVLDVYYPKPEFLINPAKNLMDFEGEYEPGKRLRRYVSAEPDIISQTSNLIVEFEWVEDGTVQRFKEEFGIRYYYKFEMLHLLKHSGFKVDHLYGDFERSELVTGKWEQIFVCSLL